MRPGLRVAVIQCDPCVGDLDANSEKILHWLRKTETQRADLAVFPEMCLPGYPPEDLLFKRSFIDANLRALKRVAAKTRSICAVVGFIDRDESGLLYNAAALLERGKIRAVYRKRELPNYGVFDEKRYFCAGQDAKVVIVRGFRVGLTICEDIWVRDSFAYRPPYRGASIILNLSASPYHQGKQVIRRRLAADLARATGASVVYANLVGGQDELVFDGGSLITSPNGTILGEAPLLEEGMILADLPGTKPARVKRSLSSEAEVFKALCLGTRDYVDKNGFEKVVIGISGGIDSALVAKIAVTALGASRVLGVTMPSRYTSKATLADSRALARSLGFRLEEISIEPAYEALLRSLSGAFRGQGTGNAEENLQARVRGNLLMALSNKFGHLVLTTGNKSEMATGYCTLYGDMAGGFAVIKDVPKTLVYRLARYTNKHLSGGRIPESILKRPPTAELRFGQKDQDTLPPYAVLDRILQGYIEEHLSVEQISHRGIDRSVVRKVARMVDRNEYKRRQSPPGVKITPLAFGRDRRMPITQRFGA